MRSEGGGGGGGGGVGRLEVGMEHRNYRGIARNVENLEAKRTRVINLDRQKRFMENYSRVHGGCLKQVRMLSAISPVHLPLLFCTVTLVASWPPFFSVLNCAICCRIIIK